MKSCRDLIVDQINVIKTSEQYFTSREWKNNFVSFVDPETDCIAVRHLSIINFSTLLDSDLVRLFEYIIRCQVDITSMRANSFIHSITTD